MEHVILGIIQGLIAISLILVAIMVSPKLERIGIAPRARYSFAAVFIALGAYLGWVAGLFFEDKLHGANYHPTIILLRVVSLVAILHLAWSAYRCDRRGK